MNGGTQKGFTLIELMVVVVIITVLMGLLSGAIIRARDRAVARRIETEIDTIESAVTIFHHEYGYWPGTYSASGDQVTTDPNVLVMRCLDPDNASYNPHRINFLNKGEYRFDSQGNVLYSQDEDDEYEISIDLVRGTVTVRVP